MKIQLSEIDRRLIERVCDDILEETGIDDDNWIEVDDILAILDSLEDKYSDAIIEFEDYREHIKEVCKPCDVNDNWNYYAKTIEKLGEECDRQYQFIIKRGLKEEYDKYGKERTKEE